MREAGSQSPATQNYWTTYTHATLQVLCWTDNDDAYAEYGFGLDDQTDAYSVYRRIAYCAMVADITDTATDFEDLIAAMGEVEDEEEVTANS